MLTLNHMQELEKLHAGTHTFLLSFPQNQRGQTNSVHYYWIHSDGCKAGTTDSEHFTGKAASTQTVPGWQEEREMLFPRHRQLKDTETHSALWPINHQRPC